MTKIHQISQFHEIIHNLIPQNIKNNEKFTQKIVKKIEKKSKREQEKILNVEKKRLKKFFVSNFGVHDARNKGIKSKRRVQLD